VIASWDTALDDAVAHLGVRVEEEGVLDDVLRDVGRP